MAAVKWKLTLAVAVLFLALAKAWPARAVPDPASRIECFPLDAVTEADCLADGCLWEQAADGSGIPSCFLPSADIYGYELQSNPEVTNSSLLVNLVRRPSSFSLYGDDVEEITFEATYYSDEILGFRLYPKGEDSNRFRPPVSLALPEPGAASDRVYDVVLESDQVGGAFNVRVVRKSTGSALFDTSLGGLTVARQFLMISTTLASRFMYGLGENPHASFAHDLNYRTWPLFTRDMFPTDGEINLYGSHPFYTVLEDDGAAHGVFLFNSHAIDVTTLPHPGLTFRTIGGQLEFFIFVGANPESVIQHYTSVIGRTLMPPYWALGFQMCRWGYSNTQEIRDVIERNRAVGIPQDVQFADIDYMDHRADFTLGADFQDLPDYIREIQAEGMHFISILDPAIDTERPNYTTHQRALDNDVYVKWFNSSLKPESNCTVNPDECQDLGDVMLGRVWPPGRTAFPDWLKERTQNWWIREIEEFHQTLPFDGIWIDMNEPSNFGTNGNSRWSLQCPVNQWDDPPYRTKAAPSADSRLSDKTLCMVGKQGPSDEFLHYSVHSLYGWSQSEPTLRAARSATGKRSIVISRSTYPSSGRWTGHWLGDNMSRWVDMHRSIIGMMEYNLFGISYIGADICGFMGNTSEELCQRWMELGAFYPFSRNHNSIGFLPQDPAQWETVANSSRTALNIRYRLLPYLYTLFYWSHTAGSTVIRPLFHEFPTDSEARLVDRQFLWGPAFLISPVLEKEETSVDAYFPDDVWYDFYTGEAVGARGSRVTLDAPLDKINLHIRGGYILPLQQEALTTHESRKNNFSLIVAIGSGNSARGDLFWDDGESIELGSYQLSEFNFNSDVLVMSIKESASAAGLFHQEQFMDSVDLLGLAQKPASVGYGQESLDFDYDPVRQKLQLRNLRLSMTENWELRFNY